MSKIIFEQLVEVNPKDAAADWHPRQHELDMARAIHEYFGWSHENPVEGQVKITVEIIKDK
jgi:hypothetical protein